MWNEKRVWTARSDENSGSKAWTNMQSCLSRLLIHRFRQNTWSFDLLLSFENHLLNIILTSNSSKPTQVTKGLTHIKFYTATDPSKSTMVTSGGNNWISHIQNWSQCESSSTILSATHPDPTVFAHCSYTAFPVQEAQILINQNSCRGS